MFFTSMNFASPWSCWVEYRSRLSNGSYETWSTMCGLYILLILVIHIHYSYSGFSYNITLFEQHILWNHHYRFSKGCSGWASVLCMSVNCCVISYLYVELQISCILKRVKRRDGSGHQHRRKGRRGEQQQVEPETTFYIDLSLHGHKAQPNVILKWEKYTMSVYYS